MPAFTPPPDEDPGYYNGSYLPGSYITPTAGRPATVYNWNLEVQHQLAEDLLATVGYIGNHSTGVVGLDESKGRALLAELLAHATQPQFTYTHRWQLGDLVMWDNRCLLHRAVNNYDSSRYARVMHRSVVRGPMPV